MSQSRAGAVLSVLKPVNESKEELGWYVVAKNGAVIDGPYDTSVSAQKEVDKEGGRDSDGDPVTVEYGTCDQKGWFHKDGI